MYEELISKKDLLVLMNISYGQLYRWKRKNLIANQTADQFCVYNAEDEVIVNGLSRTKATCVPFSLTSVVDGAYLSEGDVYFKDEKIIDIESILLKGDHNLQDVLGAVAVSKLYG